MAKCSAITQAGTACKGIPMDGSSYCYVHHPEHQEERRRHGAKGGKRGGRVRPLAELTGIKARLSDLADDVLEEKVDRGAAAVAGQLFNAVIRAIGMEMKVREVEELSARLETLEESLDSKRKGRTWGA